MDSMNGYAALVEEIRAYQRAHEIQSDGTPYGGVKRPDHAERAAQYKTYADAVEALGAERDALRAQLDGMTTEWGVGLGDMFMNQYETRENAEFVVDCRGDMDFRLLRRSVGPWVEVE